MLRRVAAGKRTSGRCSAQIALCGPACRGRRILLLYKSLYGEIYAGNMEDSFWKPVNVSEILKKC